MTPTPAPILCQVTSGQPTEVEAFTLVAPCAPACNGNVCAPTLTIAHRPTLRKAAREDQETPNEHQRASNFRARRPLLFAGLAARRARPRGFRLSWSTSNPNAVRRRVLSPTCSSTGRSRTAPAAPVTCDGAGAATVLVTIDGAAYPQTCVSDRLQRFHRSPLCKEPPPTTSRWHSSTTRATRLRSRRSRSSLDVTAAAATRRPVQPCWSFRRRRQ